MSEHPRQDFLDAIPRYFSGDLDRVELRWFEGLRSADPALGALFREAWDRETEARGLLALRPGDPGLSDCFSFATLSRFVLGELGPEDAGIVADHRSCPLCGPQLEALSNEASLRPAATEPRPAVRSGAKVLTFRRRVLGATLALAAGVLALTLMPQKPKDGSFVPRGGEAGLELQRLVGVELRARSEGEPASPLVDGGQLRSGARLEVHWRNLSSDHTYYVMVFAVTFGGEVLWYAPSWTDPAADPGSPLLRPKTEAAVLEEAVGHALDPGPLRVVVALLPAPLHVKEVESRLGSSPLRGEELSLGEGVVQRSYRVTVLP